MKYVSTLCTVFLALLLLFFVTFIIAAAYDEGMIEESFVSEWALAIFDAFKFPLLKFESMDWWRSVVGDEFYTPLFINIVIDTVLISALVEFLHKHLSKSELTLSTNADV